MLVVYVIQKSKQYGLKQSMLFLYYLPLVVYVIQKSKQYGLKQSPAQLQWFAKRCVCHSKK